MTPSNQPPTLWIEDGGSPKVFEMFDDVVVVGRDPEVDLVLDNHRVSRRHATIRVSEDGALRLEDLGSSNGTNVNGQPVDGDIELEPGDIVEIGPFRLHIGMRPLAADDPEAAAVAASSTAAPRRTRHRTRRGKHGSKSGLVIAICVLLVAGGVGLWASGMLGPKKAPDEGGAARPVVAAAPKAPPKATSPAAPAPSAPTAPTAAPAVPAPATPAEEAPPASPPGDREEFANALHERRFIDAGIELERLGSPPELAKQFERATVRAALTIRIHMNETWRAYGIASAAAYLREEIAKFPAGSLAREELTATLHEMPLGGAAPAGEVANAKTAEAGVEGGKTEDAPAPKRPADEKPADEKPAPPPAKPDAPAVDPALVAQVDKSDALLRDRSYADAEQGYEAATATLATMSPPLGARHVELQRRIERGQRAILRVRAFFDALGAVAGTAREAVGRIPGAAGHSGHLVGADRDAITLETDRGREQVRWRVVPLSTLKALVKRAPLEPQALVDGAVLLRLSGALDEAALALARAYRKAPELKPAIDQELAEARQIPLPKEGFTLEGDEWLSPAEIARRELNKKIAAETQRLQAADSLERSAAFDTLYGLKEVGKAQLHSGLLAAWKVLEDGLAKNAAVTPLLDIPKLRVEIDARRAEAMALIFDEKRYPYPYKADEAGPEAFAAYQESQPIVDSLTAKVKEVWKDGRAPKITPAARELGDRFRQLEGWILKNGFGPAPGTMEWITSLPADETLTIRNVASSPADRRRIDESAAILQDNETAPGVASRGEQVQARVTNEYRLMMGLRALRLYDALGRASRGHCEDMVRLGFFSHTSRVPGKETPMDRVRLAGMNPGGLSENIAIAGGPEGAHNGWLHSPGHHRNILGRSWRLIGVGNSGSRWCQNFSIRDQGGEGGDGR